MDGQLKELCTNYNVAGIWFDGMWDKPDAEWRLGKTYRIIHDCRSDIMIGSNHHVSPYPGEDFQMFEKGLPGQDPFSKEKHVSEAIALEMCETINNSWGYNRNDRSHKSTKALIHLLVKAVGHNANLLLNVGPRPDGTIQEAHLKRLAEVGQWLRGREESIFGTRGGPVPPRSWGVTTHRGDTVYVHILSDTDDVIAVPDFGKTVTSASLLNGAAVDFVATPLGALIKVPPDTRDPIDTIIVLHTES